MKCLLVEHELLAAYTPDGYTVALKQAIAQAKPDLVLLPHTYQVRDFAPKLAASLGKGMIGDCVGYRQENGKLIFVRQMFQGKTAADVVFEGAAPWFATFQAGAFRADLVAQGASKAPVTPVSVRSEAGTDSNQAAGTVPRSEAGRGPDAGAHPGGRRARNQGAGKYSAGGKTRQAARRGTRRVAPHLR